MKKLRGKKGALWDTIAIIIALFALGVLLYLTIKWIVVGGSNVVPTNASEVAKTILSK